MATVLFTNATVLDTVRGEQMADQAVLVEDGHIREVAATAEVLPPILIG